MPKQKTSRIIPKFIRDMQYTEDERQDIARAYWFGRDRHRNQLRKSGEAYIIHPIAVAQILAGWHVDIPTIQAGLLHDTLEDTQTTSEEIRAEFGEVCTQLVEAVTKIGSLQSQIAHTATPESIENIRKLLLAMSHDIRVILVKLADRLHNMRTIQYLSEHKQRRKAQETLDIYAPIADRLGMGELRAELEDRSFAVVHPKEYARIKELAQPYVKRGEQLLATIKPEIEADCRSEGIQFEVTSRIKNVFSIHKKLAKYDQDFSKIRDLVALRIIVESIPDCYRALGLIHARYKPLLLFIKDYIAVPKPNGYQSLHTTVLGKNQVFEVQIRTQHMHEYAEQGLAAHFYYNESKQQQQYKTGGGVVLPKKYEWVKNLLDWQEAFEHEKDIRSALQLDVFQQRIFVFSPNGDLFDLPEGATPVDFAFAVHTDLGMACRGARINGKMMPLDTRLENRDVVEIFAFVKAPRPSRDWLSFVVTAKARSRIKAWLRNQERTTAEQEGMRLLDEYIRTVADRSWEQLPPSTKRVVLESYELSDSSALAEAVYEGKVKLADISRLVLMQRQQQARAFLPVKFLRKRGPRPVSLVPGIEREHISRAGCCSPTYPQEIVGYVSRAGLIRVHRKDCDRIAADFQRCLPAYWYYDSTDRIRLKGDSAMATSMLKAISSYLSAFDARAAKITQNSIGDTVEIEVALSLVRMDRWADLLRALHRVPGVLDVEHIVG